MGEHPNQPYTPNTQMVTPYSQQNYYDDDDIYDDEIY
jgi:hypothetical protein